MKNKSKLKKIKNKATGPNIPRDWFYMCADSLPARDLYNIIEESDSFEGEIWEDAGIIEVVLGEKASMDFEEGQLDFEDEFSLNFIKDNLVSSIYYVSFPNTSYDRAQELMKLIISKAGGFFCGDSEDFSPIIK